MLRGTGRWISSPRDGRSDKWRAHNFWTLSYGSLKPLVYYLPLLFKFYLSKIETPRVIKNYYKAERGFNKGLDSPQHLFVEPTDKNISISNSPLFRFFITFRNEGQVIDSTAAYINSDLSWLGGEYDYVFNLAFLEPPITGNSNSCIYKCEWTAPRGGIGVTVLMSACFGQKCLKNW